MRVIYSLIACLSLLLASCSPYKEVSLNSFQQYNISKKEQVEIEYYLKGSDLLYSDIDSRNNVHHYDTDKSTIKESYSYLVQDNILIPKGASGNCVGSSENSMIIDFGRGIVVPFVISNEHNKASGELKVDDRKYSLVRGRKPPRLYFNTRDFRPGIE